MSTLNNRTGLISGCRHSRKLLLKTALMTCHAPHATHHAPRLVYIVFFSLCIVDFNRYFWQKPLCVERNLGIKKNWERGERWEGERVEERFLPLPIVPQPFLFFDYCYFYWNTQREPLQRREQLPDDNRDDCFARRMTFWVAKHIQDHSSVYFLLLFNVACVAGGFVWRTRKWVAKPIASAPLSSRFRRSLALSQHYPFLTKPSAKQVSKQWKHLSFSLLTNSNYSFRHHTASVWRLTLKFSVVEMSRWDTILTHVSTR